MTGLRGLTGAVAASATLLASHVWSAEPSWADKKVTFELGAFLSDFDTNVELRGPTGGGAVNLEDVLGLDPDQTAFRGELQWRFADRHRLTAAYYQFNRQATAETTRSFVIETQDQILEFEAETALETEFDWRLIPIFYTYSFVQNERLEASASIGVHWLNVKVGYAGSAHVNGNPVIESAGESETASAPLPVIGLDAVYGITQNWYLGARGQYFGLDFDEYSGDLTDLRLMTEYRIGRTFGIGIGYTWYNIDFTRDRGDYQVGIEYDYSGPEAFLKVWF